MAQQVINIGAAPNDGTGDTLRAALDKVNTNFTELYTSGLMTLIDGVAAPSTIAGHAVIYVDAADGDLKIKFADGVVKTVVTDT